MYQLLCLQVVLDVINDWIPFALCSLSSLKDLIPLSTPLPDDPNSLVTMYSSSPIKAVEEHWLCRSPVVIQWQSELIMVWSILQ